MNTIVSNRLDIRPFASLGHADHGWLDAHHHFSFADYYDHGRMGWGSLRVWNDDVIAAGAGFPPHPHADMEIITYVRQGAITHRDSMGNVGRTEAGDVQVMSAGSGVRHSEYNLEDEETRIFQIWIIPEQRGGEPAWGTRPFPKSDADSGWRVFASGFAEDEEALPIRTSARVLGARLKAGESIDYQVGEGRHAYLVPATGRISIDGEMISARDGVALRGGDYRVTASEEAELVLVDAE
ncbi:MAG: pirin family protein [Sphingomonadales bacterium]|nr:MAG: pirin family protein [Sphingomonadales bacterium]TNF05144.1 MAG: pirin family protein [Sphingomonadales bacterium]